MLSPSSNLSFPAWPASTLGSCLFSTTARSVIRALEMRGGSLMFWAIF